MGTKNYKASAQRRWIVLFVIVLVVGGAVFLLRRQRPDPDAGLQRQGDPPLARKDRLLRDEAEEAGLDFTMRFLPQEQGATFKINLYDHGCGLAVGDYDADGWDDIYFVNQLGPNALFRNKGDGSFEDVTDRMQVGLGDRICVGATFADYDNDGDQDLFVTSTRGGNELFKNLGGKFVLATEEAGLQHVGHSQSALFFDYDSDGNLDLLVTNTAQWTSSQFDEESKYYVGKGNLGLMPVFSSPKEYNILYHNDGDGTFTDVTKQSGLAGRGWAGDAAVLDFDEDGDLDVLVVCMFGPAQLYRNNGNATFTDVTATALGRTPFGGVGARVLDYNNDGHFDIYIVDMHSDMWMGVDFKHSTLDLAIKSEKIKYDYSLGPMVEDDEKLKKHEQEVSELLGFNHSEVVFGNALFKSNGDGTFTEVSNETNTETMWPWGIAAGDFDNNGHQDLFVASGMGYPFYYWNNYVLMNDGRGAFEDRSFATGVEPPRHGEFLPKSIKGQKSARSSRCAATGDFDGDGRLEIVTNNFNDRPYFFRNYFPKSNFLAFELQGTSSNRDAIGATVRITLGNGATMTRQVHASSGYLSQSSKTIHFGLGDAKRVASVSIRWPNGRTQEIEAPAINKRHRVVESNEAAQP